MSGVGFLGAGVIFKHGAHVRGLNTATTTTRLRALLPSTINSLPITLQSIHGEQDEDKDEIHLRAELTNAGRNNEAVEQVVMRPSMEDEISALSWSIVESTME